MSDKSIKGPEPSLRSPCVHLTLGAFVVLSGSLMCGHAVAGARVRTAGAAALRPLWGSRG